MDLNSLDDLIGALDDNDLLARLQGNSAASSTEADEDEDEEEPTAPPATPAQPAAPAAAASDSKGAAQAPAQSTPAAQKAPSASAAPSEPPRDEPLPRASEGKASEAEAPSDALPASEDDVNPLDFDFEYPTVSDAADEGLATEAGEDLAALDALGQDPIAVEAALDEEAQSALAEGDAVEEEWEFAEEADAAVDLDFGDDAGDESIDGAENAAEIDEADPIEAQPAQPAAPARPFAGQGDFAEAVAAADQDPEGEASRQRRDELAGAALAAAAGLAVVGAGTAALRRQGDAARSPQQPSAAASANPFERKPAPLAPVADSSAPGRADGGSKLRKPQGATQSRASASPAAPSVSAPIAQESAREASASPSASAAPAEAAGVSGAMGFFKAPEQRPFAPETAPEAEALKAKAAPNPYLAALSAPLRGAGSLDPRHARVASEAIAAQSLAFRLARADAPLLRWDERGLDAEPSPLALEKAFFGDAAQGPLCSSLDLAPAQESLIELFAALWRMSRAPTARAFAVAAQSASERAQPLRDKLRAQWEELRSDSAPAAEGARMERVGLGMELCERVLWALSPERVADALLAARMENRPRAAAQAVPDGFFDSAWSRASGPLRRVLEDAAARKAEKRAIIAYGSDAPGSAIWRQACKKHLIEGLRQAVESLNRFGLASFEIHGVSIEGPFDLAERAQRFTGAASRACQKLGARSRAFGLARRLGVSLDDPRLAAHPQAPLALFDLAGCRALASSRFAGLDASLMHEWTHALDARSGAALMGPKAWLEAGCPFASALSARLSQRGKRLDELTLPERLHGVPAPKEDRRPAGDAGDERDGLRAHLEARKGSGSSRRSKAIRPNGGSEWTESIESPFDAPSSRPEPMTAEAILGAPSDPLDLEIFLATEAQTSPAKRLARAWGSLVSGAIGAHEGLGAWSGHARLAPGDGARARAVAQAMSQSQPFDSEELARLESRAAAQTLRPILARALTVCGEPLARDPKALRSMLLAFGPEAKPWLDGLAAALASGGASNFKTRLKRVKNRLQDEADRAAARGEIPDADEATSDGKGRGGKGRGSGSAVSMPESLWARSLSEFGKLREAFLNAKGRPQTQDKLLEDAGVSRDQFARAREAEKSLESQLGNLTRDAAQKMIRKSRMLGRPVENPEQLAAALLSSAENALDSIAQWALTHTTEGHFSPRPNAFFAESARLQFQDPQSAFAARWRSSDELAARAVENLAPKASWLDFARPQAAAFNIPLGPQGRDRLRASLRDICRSLELPVSKRAPGPETIGERALAMQEALLSRFDSLRSARALEESKATLLRRPPARH